jgi:quercetin dioxygenase-like cupin family protein
VYGVLNEEIARDFVLGSLSPAERAEVRRARLSDAELDEAIERLEAQLAPLTGLAGEVAPPPGLLDRVTDAVAAERGEFQGKDALEAGEGRWLRYRPGIQARRMWNRRTIMLRCRPGAVLPAHEHGEDEHIVVISGDFVVGGRVFGAGDYHHSPRGVRHGDAFTRTGCLLLVQYGD